MSDGFPLRSSVDAILFRGEVDADADRFQASFLVFDRDHKTGEVLTQCVRASKAS
jgi:hypothetical protein